MVKFGYAALLLPTLFVASSSEKVNDLASKNQRRLRSGSGGGSKIEIQPISTKPKAEPDANHRQLNIATLVESIREEIRDLIRNNSVLAPKFLRLAFHDCVGGCDGCVDMTDPDNAGLDIPIGALSGIVSTWKSNDISRADIWSLAAMVGSEMTQAQRDFK